MIILLSESINYLVSWLDYISNVGSLALSAPSLRVNDISLPNRGIENYYIGLDFM